MAEELLRSKHGFGKLQDLNMAIESGQIDEYDIVFLDGETDPKIGWIDRDGIARIVDHKDIFVVDSLPTKGIEGKIYICQSQCFIWDGLQFLPLLPASDITEEMINDKLDALKADVNAYTDRKFSSIKASIDAVDIKIESVKADVGILKSDVNEVKSDLGVVKTNVDEVKTDVNKAKEDINLVKTDVNAVKTDVDNIKTDIDSVKTSVNEVKTDIKNVNAEFDLVKSDVNTVKSNMDTLESNIGVIESDIEKTKTDIDGLKSDVSSINKELYSIPYVYEKVSYEIFNTPEGTLVDYRDDEIRVMCPVNAVWEKQNVGATGNENMYYMGFKAYAPTNAVSFKEGDRGVIIDQMYTFDDDFAGTDEFGRNYSVCWLALASYDATSDQWTYYGKNSSAEKYIGWDYIVEWYDSNGMVIAADSIRINLSNEECHFLTQPYYIGKLKKEIDTKIEETIVEVESAYEIFEF